MNISLDWDDTVTRDPDTWLKFVDLMQEAGHNVYCVTMRSQEEGRVVKELLASRVDGIFFTNRQAKKDFMAERGVRIDVWVDDNPAFILHDAAS